MTKHKTNTAGFTLIEILIVMVIVSIVGSLTVFTISQNHSTALKAYVQQLRNTLLLAEQHALLESTDLGLHIASHELNFYQYYAENDKYIALPAKTLHVPALPKKSFLTLQLKQPPHDKETDDSAPQIVFSSSGEVTPFVLFVGTGELTPLYTLRIEKNGTIILKKLNGTHSTDEI